MSFMDKILHSSGAMPLAAGALVAGVLSCAPANAQYAFGYSDNDLQETLILSTKTGPVTLNTNGFQGFFSDSLSNTAGPDGSANYIVGALGPGANANNFFAFDISKLGGVKVTGVTLSVSSYSISDNLTYYLGDASALANAGKLANGVSPDLTIFNALGHGGLGAFALTPADSNTTVSFQLNGLAVGAINRDIARGDDYFALGGTLSPVPEPSTWAMMLAGFAGLGVLGYRRRRSAAPAA
jgi:hypothetical protein